MLSYGLYKKTAAHSVMNMRLAFYLNIDNLFVGFLLYILFSILFFADFLTHCEISNRSSDEEGRQCTENYTKYHGE